MAEQRHRRPAGLILRPRDAPAERRLDTQGSKIIHVDRGPLDALRRIPADEVEGPRLRHAEAREAMIALAEGGKLQHRHAERIEALAHGHAEDQPVEAGDRQPAQQQGVGRAEDGGVGADAERQGEHRDGGEARILAQHARAEAQVSRQGLGESHAERVPAFLLGAIDAAEVQPRLPHRRRPRHAAADQVLGVRLEVEAELRIHVAFPARAPEDGPRPGTQAAPESHTSSGVVRRIPAMTSAMRCHFSASACSRRFPAAVSR